MAFKEHCPFYVQVRVDSVGFYITLRGKCGDPYHQGHPRFVPASLLAGVAVDDIMHVNNATVNNGTCREFIVGYHVINLQSIVNLR